MSARPTLATCPRRLRVVRRLRRRSGGAPSARNRSVVVPVRRIVAGRRSSPRLQEMPSGRPLINQTGSSSTSVASNAIVAPSFSASAAPAARLPASTSRHSPMPSAARPAASTYPAPAATAASARCTVASCSRRRIHQAAGRGPRKVETMVSAPAAATASITVRGLASSHARAPSRSSGGRPSRTRRGSRSAPARSVTIWAAQRSPRPTCLSRCSSVQPGHVGTGVVRPAANRTSPNKRFCSTNAAA